MDVSKEIASYITIEDLKNNPLLLEIAENDTTQGIETARNLILNQGGMQGIPKINYYKSAIQRFIIANYYEIPTNKMIRELRNVLNINERSIKRIMRDAINSQYKKNLK